MCGALTLSNEFISRDEGLHRNFAVALIQQILAQPNCGRKYSIVEESVKAEEMWVRNSALARKTGRNEPGFDVSVREVRCGSPPARLTGRALHTKSAILSILWTK